MIGGFGTLRSCAVFAGVVACRKISNNFESELSLLLPMGGKVDPGVEFWMACIRSCAVFYLIPLMRGKEFYCFVGKFHSA